MSYEPLDNQITENIPLRDLEANELADNDSALDLSDSSEMFDEIDEFNKTSRNSSEQTDFCDSPVFHKEKELYFGSSRISKRTLIVGSIIFIVTWLIGLLVYANETNRIVTANEWHSTKTNIVSLKDRNITLNRYLASLPNITMAEYRKGSYFPDERMVRWLLKAQRPYVLNKDVNTAAGYFLTRDRRAFTIRQAETDYTKTILSNLQFLAYNNFFYVEDLLLNPATSVDDMDAWHLIQTDLTPQWRHLSFSLYWLWQPLTGTYKAIAPSLNSETSLEKLHFASFKPSGDAVVFGHNHDLYLLDLSTMETTRITETGSSTIFNGKPDWVYEEEVYPHAEMLWWSPDLKYLVYASINDTGVQQYDLDYYVKDAGEVGMSYDFHADDKVEGVNQYPIKTSIHYPKPGTKNPQVSLFSYEVSTGQTKTITKLSDDDIGPDFALYHAQWLDSKNLLLKLTDRTSTTLKKKVFLAEEHLVVTVSTTNSTEYNGWIEKQQPVIPLGGKSGTAYVDRVVEDMHVHLALFDLAQASKASKILTPVRSDSAVAYNAADNEIYYVTESEMNHEVKCLSLNDDKVTVLASEKGKFDISFNHDGQFANLRYRGPLEPWQTLVDMAEWREDSRSVDQIKPFSDVQRLSKALSEVNVPTRVYSQIKVGRSTQAVELNVIEIFPPNFDPSKKHPLLVHAYGGPGSVTVDKAFVIDFQDIVSASLSAVVLIIDPRGTGGNDWNVKSWAREQIGVWEAEDIIAVTKDYIAKNDYIDDKHTSIWGWSYGGFTTLKTLEKDKGKTFKFGMAVAPVTNWLFYDSIYTERYMKSPVHNKNYEKTSRINDFDSFKQVSRFLVMAGTADDNVHFQNILWLLDNLNVRSIENYDMQIFPDSDHSIYYHNANAVVFDKLLNWLTFAFQGLWD